MTWLELVTKHGVDAVRDLRQLLADLPVDQRLEAVGLTLEYTGAAFYRGKTRDFYGVTEAG